MAWQRIVEAHIVIAQLAEQVRAGGGAIRVRGSGTWLDAGRPLADDAVVVDVSHLRGVTEYVPGDLTITVLGGTTLAELHTTVGAKGQRLALDPYGSDAGTIGATVATASAGPLAGAYGTPRDQVLGASFVTGTGEVVRAGGRVVKNVAGFDLVRLVTGAWGTLGIVAEVTLRLRASPAVDRTLAITLDTGDDARVQAAIRAVRALPFTFDACELVDGATARALGMSGIADGAMLVRSAGTPDVVRAMHGALATVGACTDTEADVWAKLRQLEPAGCATVRLSSRPTGAQSTWRAARELARTAGGWTHMSLGRTVARVTVPRGAENDDAFAARILAAAAPLGNVPPTVIAERLPSAAWADPRFDRRRDAVHAGLTAGVRAAFDPAHRLNPGILGALGGDA